ncbi:hypothetical protein BD324DRAFT_650162 [Kockovaella imperatae]|uniref:Uncharacterized protein n=1 Tax=Kockovaella imperatae TaxID=4999 RepID=A0A1Y1UHU5_9TREE|nr:hypothetical protein BD324DRAFT_650162 [Kockovaella imperatae]ORX37592.1 hypothetical protein BD324DRAFT_650162 [Kockovaella imperatae]
MSSSAGLGPISQQYAAAATVPLIKSPSLYLPRPIELPNDIHPLPEDITAYFVYPFTLEEHVLSIKPSPHEAIAAKRAHNAEILHQREVQEEQREKEALHKVAPGYNPTAVLLPTSSSPAPGPKPIVGTSTLNSRVGTIDRPAAQTSLDPMDDLVSQLELLESKR